MTAPLHAARFDEALQAIQLFTGWNGGWTPVERRRESRVRSFWRPSMAPGLPELVRAFDERYSDEVALGLPQTKRANGGVSGASILWARVEGAEQVARAQRFKPRPTIVLQEGTSSRRLLIWALDHFAGYFQVADANRKIAYALRATQKHGDPDALMIAAPGTCLKVGRARVVVIRSTRLTTETSSLKRIVGKLREPPAKDGWMSASGR